jgi:hypothetical protein
VRAAPAVSQACCKRIDCPRAYRFSGEHPALPAQWLLLIRDRPGDPAFCDTITLRQRWQPSNLMPASARRTQTISPCATDALVLHTLASTAPCPMFATTADAPLERQDGGSHGLDLPDGASDLFLRSALDRFGDLPVGLLCRRQARNIALVHEMESTAYTFSSDVPNARFHTDRKRGNQECATAL